MYCENFSICPSATSSVRQSYTRTFHNLVRTYDLTRYFTRSISVITSMSLKCSSSLVSGSERRVSTIFCW